MLRRTADVNKRFLPPLMTFIVFCRPSPLQACTHVIWPLERLINIPCQSLASLLLPDAFPTMLCGNAQVQLYEVLLRSKAVSALLTGGSGSVAGGNVLTVITALRKYDTWLHILAYFVKSRSKGARNYPGRIMYKCRKEFYVRRVIVLHQQVT